jgi:hypothetical protein
MQVRNRLRATCARARMIGAQLISSLFQQATAQGSKSTVLRPLGWLTAICAASLLGAVEMKAAVWVLVVLATLTALSVLLYMASFGYCLITDKEALRSETYQIQRLAIEKGFVGDSLTGTLRHEATTEIATILPNDRISTAGEDQK